MDRVNEGFGFSKTGRGKTRIEEEFGIILDTNRMPHGLKGLVGRFVRISTHGANYVGVLRGITPDGEIVLTPTISPGDDYFDSKARQEERFEWVKDPIHIREEIGTYSKAGEDFLQRCASGFEGVSHLGEYMESFYNIEGQMQFDF